MRILADTMSALESQLPAGVFCRISRCALAAAMLAAAMGACFLAGAPMAQAGPDEDALLQQVKQLASKGQDAQTAAQVSQYVDQNKDALATILKGYTDYLNQAQAMGAMDGSGTPATPQTASATGTSQNANGGAAASGQQISTGLQMSAVQGSGVLRMSHLAGYPALPDVDPVSSVLRPTAAQLEYAARVQKEMQARKRYLMEHPQGYTY